MNPLQPFLGRQGVVLLDGGLATELEARGYDLADELWSARLLIENPAAIVEVHRDYLAAGADCLTAASYQATLEGLARRGLGERQAEALLRRSVHLATAVRDDFWSDPAHRPGRLRPLVAASIGPYGAYLANGAEYTGDYDLDEDGLVAFHRRRLAILADAGADLLACETIPSRREARALRRLLEAPVGGGASLPGAWISFSCRDDRHLADGSDLAATVAEIEACERLLAVGVNCTMPRFVAGLVDRLRGVTDKPIVVYPNAGEVYDAEAKRWLESAEAVDLATAAVDWQARGARLIGGCCRTGPEQIRRLRARLLAG
ncbi:MAG: homocysteine S-methyltransferase [Acidobacteriota bacterium]